MYPSSKQIDILIMLLENGHINFFEQKLCKHHYLDRDCFNKAMKPFYKLEWVKKRFIRLNGHYANEFVITAEGILAINYTFKKMML